MNAIFLDATGLIAVANTDDQWHPAAESVMERPDRFQSALGHNFLGVV